VKPGQAFLVIFHENELIVAERFGKELCSCWLATRRSKPG